MKIKRRRKLKKSIEKEFDSSQLAWEDEFQIIGSFFCQTGASIMEISKTRIPVRTRYYSPKSRKLLEIQISDAILDPVLVEALGNSKKEVAYLQSEQRIRAISRFALEGVPTHLLFQITLRVIVSTKVTFHDAFRFVTYKDFVGLLKYETERGLIY